MPAKVCNSLIDLGQKTADRTSLSDPRLLPSKREMTEDASNQATPNPGRPPEPGTTILHLDKLVSTSTEGPDSDTSVTAFIARTAAETVELSSKPVVVPKDGGSIPAGSMLGVVSYCYTKGVFASDDIGRKLASDPSVRVVAGGDIPRPEDIRRFRNLNREAIQSTVEKALAFARKKVVEAWSPTNPFRGRTGGAFELPVETLPVDGRREDTDSFVRRDASARLDKASFIDGMSM